MATMAPPELTVSDPPVPDSHVSDLVAPELAWEFNPFAFDGSAQDDPDKPPRYPSGGVAGLFSLPLRWQAS
jgi:hypothetical protein